MALPGVDAQGRLALARYRGRDARAQTQNGIQSCKTHISHEIIEGCFHILNPFYLLITVNIGDQPVFMD